MRELHCEEVVAMWLWGAEYAASGLSAIDWYESLSEGRRGTVDDFMVQYEAARERDMRPVRKTRTQLRRRHSKGGER